MDNMREMLRGGAINLAMVAAILALVCIAHDSKADATATHDVTIVFTTLD